MLIIKYLLAIFAITVLTAAGFAQNSGEILVVNKQEQKIQPDTRVIITKTLNNNPMEIKYNITTPPVDLFDFILALDSSGSMGYPDKSGTEQFTRSRAVSKAIPIFFERIPEKFPGRLFNVSIVGWNEKIDLIYGNNDDPFENINISNALLVPVARAAKDINRYPLFHMDLNNSKQHYYPVENTFTDISLPIRTSLDIYKTIENPNFYRISRFIILVIGPGEFHASDDQLIEEAYALGIPIYVIAMNVYEEEEPMLYDHLWKIANNNKAQIVFISETEEQLESCLEAALEDTLNRAISRPVAKNVTITDTLYRYLTPNIAGIKVNGIIDKTINRSEYYNNADNTTTISFELSDHLMPNSSTIVTTPIKIGLYGLPISVTQDSVPIVLNPGSNKNSSINYIWFNEKNASSELPVGHMDIESNSQTISPRSPINESRTNPGIGGIFSGVLHLMLKFNTNFIFIYIC